MNATSNILCVPNLQGERYNIDNVTYQSSWVDAKSTLTEQVEAIRLAYRDERILIGTSFGGLAAWQYGSQYQPPSLQGIVLIDVLPSMTQFPWWKQQALRVIPYLPSGLLQPLYHAMRYRQGLPPAAVHVVMQRINSFRTAFPAYHFPVPTLVLSKNARFHQTWCDIAERHPVSAERYQHPAAQIEAWMSTIDPRRTEPL